MLDLSLLPHSNALGHRVSHTPLFLQQTPVARFRLARSKYGQHCISLKLKKENRSRSQYFYFLNTSEADIAKLWMSKVEPNIASRDVIEGEPCIFLIAHTRGKFSLVFSSLFINRKQKFSAISIIFHCMSMEVKIIQKSWIKLPLYVKVALKIEETTSASAKSWWDYKIACTHVRNA